MMTIREIEQWLKTGADLPNAEAKNLFAFLRSAQVVASLRRGTLSLIRNEADHSAALLEIERLWDCPEGTPEHYRFEAVCILVDDYERALYKGLL